MGEDSVVLVGSYNLSIVLLSVLIAVIASFNAMNLALIAKDTVGRSRIRWLVVGSILMGFGIWTTHFIAMEAFTLPLIVRYDAFLTLLSILPAIAGSMAALFIIRHQTVNGKQIVLAGILLGAGISMMHYTGMAAMRMDADMQFDLLWVALSVVIAMAVASASFRVCCNTSNEEKRNLSQNKMTGAILMGGGIGGMHYTGMAALTIFSTATPYQRTFWQFGELSLAILATVAMLLTLIIFILSSTTLKRRMFGIAQKATLLSAIIILSAVTIVGQVAYRETTDLLLELELHKTNNEIDLHAIDTKASISNLQKDARFLASTPPIAGIMRADSGNGIDALDRSTDGQWRSRLQDIFSHFLLSRPEYLMIRFIGVKNSGRELVRVERQTDGEIFIQPESLLQQKAHRNYFIETMKVPAGKAYLSEINYDREFGKLVEPYQPVMRTSIPIRKPSGEMFGMLVINMDMKPVLFKLRDLDSNGDLDRVINERGDYIVHPNPNMVFGFELGERYRVQDEFPELSSLLSQDKGTLFSTINIYEHGNSMIAMARKITFDPLHPERFITLIELISPDYYAEQAVPVLKRISVFGQFIIAFAILIAFFFSNLLMRPLRSITEATEAFAEGSSRLALPLEDQSEIGDLARTFKAMTTQINERSDELRMNGQVFESALEGILVTDIDGVIQSVNPAFTDITGYSEEEVVGNNPRMIKSGHHDAGFYESMWKDILETGRWQGELWNRRKSGETYPVWETITAIKGDDGETSHYVAIFFDITERKQVDEKLQYQAQHDVLTGLPNRMLFNDLLEQILKEEQRSKGGVAVLFLDLDRFKEVNDTLGHQAGDLLLQEAAKRLEKVIRNSDVLARMGGDEFTLILRDISSINDASHIAEKIVAAANEPFLLEEHEVSIGASIGISIYPNDAEDADTLIKYADTAMYRAKDSGRNNFQFFTASMGEDLELRMQMKGAIDGAIKNREFELYFQPKVNLASGECIGAEALIRWVLPNGELVMPDIFLPLAEETGQIIDIGAWVIPAACHQMKEWHDQGYLHSMAVNLSARQFESSDLIWQLTQALEASGVDASFLDLEVTETCAMADPEKTIRVLTSMRGLGVKVSIDDFGTGYSSLSYLKKLPVNTLKIDRAFVRDIPEDSDDIAITTAVTQMASSLGLSIVAEGVENEEQRAFLNGIGCEQAQGYYFSRPLPIGEYMTWLKERGPQESEK